jgi:pilus assembly protein Flp/PilA
MATKIDPQLTNVRTAEVAAARWPARPGHTRTPVNRAIPWRLRAIAPGDGGVRHSRCGFIVRRAVVQNGVTAYRTHGVAHRTDAQEESVMTFINGLRRFAKDESGQDLLEYALLVALIALVAFGAVKLAGGSVNTIFGNIASQLSSAT